MVNTLNTGKAVIPNKTTAAPGIGRTIEPVMVAAKIASKRHDLGSMPEGTGINKIPAATASTIPHRSNLLRNPILSAGSSLDCSGGSDDGCSTRSSFDWGEHNNAGYYSLSRLLLKHFDGLNPEPGVAA